MAELMERLQKVDSGISSESGDSQPQTVQPANPNVQPGNPNHSVHPSLPNNQGHSANPNNPAPSVNPNVNPTNPIQPAVTSVLHDHEAETR